MTFHPIAATRRVAVDVPGEGLFARMIRCWIEHHQRMLDLGIPPH